MFASMHGDPAPETGVVKGRATEAAQKRRRSRVQSPSEVEENSIPTPGKCRRGPGREVTRWPRRGSVGAGSERAGAQERARRASSRPMRACTGAGSHDTAAGARRHKNRLLAAIAGAQGERDYNAIQWNVAEYRPLARAPRNTS